MLQIAPNKRPSAEEVLRHRFFDDCPEDVELPLEKLIEQQENANQIPKIADKFLSEKRQNQNIT